MLFFLRLLLASGTAAGCLMAGKTLLHYFQLESYQFPGYFRTLKRNMPKVLFPGIIMTVLLTAASATGCLLIGNRSQPVLFISLFFIMIAGGYLTGKLFSEKKAKKRFVLTPRVKRLYVVSFILLAIILLFLLKRFPDSCSPCGFLFCLFPVFLPLWIALGGLVAWPVEKAISEMYFRDAQRILKGRKDLIRIGITGSWGKTSVKFILGTILEEKYHTLITPASFNTPMGVTKVIRSRIEPGHRIFVAEMGARHVGDIREMCRLVHPQIGILTSVGPQHLDTFKTLERVTKTKYELIEALPEDGEAFFTDDEGICRELYRKTSVSKHMAGFDPEYDEIFAEDICYSPEGTSFVLRRGTERVPCETQLLGELNIRNIVLCACVALNVGLTMNQVVRGIGKVKPVEHRLQLIRHPGGLNVIDDAFNSNILGAKQAFQVLKQFPSRRIIVTPGMVELGDKEYEMNKEFGKEMAACCDTVILVGKKRSDAIVQGLRENGMREESILIVSSLDEATELLREISGPGDTVLFENDLPDNYTESKRRTGG